MSFLNKDDVVDWNAIANHCEEIEGLTILQIQSFKNSIRFLIDEFGIDFLKQTDNNHPFHFQICNYVPSTRLWFIDFAENIKSIKGFPNYSGLLKRLKDSDKFTEGFSVLDTAAKFFKSGFQLEFDPKVNVKERSKEPDLKLVNPETKEILFCEVSISNPADIQVKAQNTEMELFRVLISSFSFEFAGKIHKILSENHKAEIIKKIKNLSQSVVNGSGFEELIINGTITLGIATKENKLNLQEWAKKNNCKIGSFEGPPFDVNELQRMEFKIKKEQEQLPLNCANIIIIYDTDFFYPMLVSNYKEYLMNSISLLGESIFDLENILAVIIRGAYGGSEQSIEFNNGQHLFIQKSRYNTDVEQYLILWNRYCNFPVDSNTTSKIIGSLKQY